MFCGELSSEAHTRFGVVLPEMLPLELFHTGSPFTGEIKPGAITEELADHE